jgi:hypothetical protein
VFGAQVTSTEWNCPGTGESSREADESRVHHATRRSKPGLWANYIKEARQHSSARNPGGLLTKILKDSATEAGIALH